MDTEDELINEDECFEGEGEAGDVVCFTAGRQQRRMLDPSQRHFFHSDTDASSDGVEGAFDGLADAMDTSGDIGIDSVTCPQPLCCSSPIRSLNSSSAPDLSKFSRDQSGFEGVGQDRSVMDPIVLQAEISELKHQNRKLTEENTELRRQIATADEAHTSLLIHNEELEKKVVLCKGHAEKLKLITKELEETKANLAGHEDKHIVLKKRIDRLEKDNVILVEEIEDRRKELAALSVDLEKFRQLTKDYEEDISNIKLTSEEKITELMGSKMEIDEKLKFTTALLEEARAQNEQLRGEKLELESNLTLSHDFQYDGRLTCLEASVSAVGDITFDEEEDLISFRASSCTPVQNSIHAEIAACLRRRSCEFPQYKHDSLITYTTSGSSFPWDLESSDFSHRMRSILCEILEALTLIREEFYIESSDREEKDGIIPNPDSYGLKDTVVGTVGSPGCKTIEKGDAAVVNSSHEAEGGPKEVDVVRRIHEELAEFRVQLKKSQELFHAFNTTQTFEVTKSCPLLADDNESGEKVAKPQLSTVATQTDVPAVVSSSSSPLPSAGESRSPPAHCTSSSATAGTAEDVENLSNFMNKLTLDDNELDKLSLDDDSYRLTINLPTVLEESEQETETSPATIPRRMSSDQRPRLKRMSQFEEPNRSENESEREFYSPPSSLPSSKNTSTYNSLERPLQFSAASPSIPPGDDRESMLSDSTYGSPVSSPSYYYTPSQGSSEETIANNDGDKTPVNEDFVDEIAMASDPCDSNRGSPKYLQKRDEPIGRLKTPIDDRSNSFAHGVIDESAREELTQYAVDTVRRSVSPPAAVLCRDEWRTLRNDLRAKELAQYNKNFAQEEGTDNDAMDRGPLRSGDTMDADDEAEENIFETHFPNVVEKIFESLDRLKVKARPDFKITETEFQKINNRFRRLSDVFKTDHATLRQREDQSNKELGTLRHKINDNVASVKLSVEKVRQCLDSLEYNDYLHSIDQNSEELLINTEALTKKSKEVGRIDLEKRVYKLIEVMILYVHILRNYQIPSQEQTLPKKPSHDDGKEDSVAAKKFNGNIPSNNNNNNDKVRWTGGYLGEGQRMERWISKGYEFVRRELSWPWNWEQTWKGVKQCFSVLLMLTGLLLIFKSVFPIVSADTSGCNGHSTTLLSLVGKQASLIHEERPTL